MRRRTLWTGVAVVAVVVATLSIIALPSGPEWTTSSVEALSAFEAGLDAEMKMYPGDALRHFERAVELDRDFLVAKLRLAEYVGFSNRKRATGLIEEVSAAGLDAVQPRERFLIRYDFAKRQRKAEEAQELLDEYLADNPDDFHVLQIKAIELMSSDDGTQAEYLYRRLLEIEPNYVLAYGQLGYITMFNAKFAEAEEYFTSYRFIAPGQANPHDSLGELYIIQGRYDEAEICFETAIDIKPDFWPSHRGLIRTRQLLNDYQGARVAIDGFAALDDAPEFEIERLRCRVRYAEAAANESWSRMLEEDFAECLEHGRADEESLPMYHLAACRMGEWVLAEKIEARVGSALDEVRDRGAAKVAAEIHALLAHLEGVRLAIRGELEAAEARFREADGAIRFGGAGSGIFKLTNQTMLVETLMARGEDAAAHRTLARIRAVNPTMVDEFEESGFSILGLDRG